MKVFFSLVLLFPLSTSLLAIDLDLISENCPVAFQKIIELDTKLENLENDELASVYFSQLREGAIKAESCNEVEEVTYRILKEVNEL